jgi:hypothetical protein
MEETEKKKPSRLLLIAADDLHSTVFDKQEDDRKENTLMDKLEPPVGDSLLIALRRIFSLTYIDSTNLEKIKKAFSEIRQYAIDALEDYGPMLSSLRLKAIKTDKENNKNKVLIFKYVVVYSRDLKFKVKMEETGQTLPMSEVTETAEADDLLIGLRKIISLTFSEIFNYRDYIASLFEIRMISSKALVPLNSWLEGIDLEPVAMPTKQYDESEYEEN